MNEIIDKRTLNHLLLLLAGVFLFNGTIRLPFISDWLDKYPLIFIILAIGLVYYVVKNK